MSERTYTGVLDRFEEDDAVLLLEANGETVEELVVPKTVLPSEGRHRDAVFEISVLDDRSEFAYDSEQTRRRKNDAQRRFDRLSSRLPSTDDDRS